MWPRLVKIQYTELKLSCRNDPVVKTFIYSNSDLDLCPNDLKITCGRGRTLFILSSLPLYRLIIYIDGRILWCTHLLFILSWISKQFFHWISFKYSCLEYGDIVAVVFYHFRNMPGSFRSNTYFVRHTTFVKNKNKSPHLYDHIWSPEIFLSILVWLVLGRRTCAQSGPNKVWLVLGRRTSALSGLNKVWLVLGWRTGALSGQHIFLRLCERFIEKR
jgi:hypothetical protein